MFQESFELTPVKTKTKRRPSGRLLDLPVEHRAGQCRRARSFHETERRSPAVLSPADHPTCHRWTPAGIRFRPAFPSSSPPSLGSLTVAGSHTGPRRAQIHGRARSVVDVPDRVLGVSVPLSSSPRSRSSTPLSNQSPSMVNPDDPSTRTATPSSTDPWKYVFSAPRPSCLRVQRTSRPAANPS